MGDPGTATRRGAWRLRCAAVGCHAAQRGAGDRVDPSPAGGMGAHRLGRERRWPAGRVWERVTARCSRRAGPRPACCAAAGPGGACAGPSQSRLLIGLGDDIRRRVRRRVGYLISDSEISDPDDISDSEIIAYSETRGDIRVRPGDSKPGPDSESETRRRITQAGMPRPTVTPSRTMPRCWRATVTVASLRTCQGCSRAAVNRTRRRGPRPRRDPEGGLK